VAANNAFMAAPDFTTPSSIAEPAAANSQEASVSEEEGGEDSPRVQPQNHSTSMPPPASKPKTFSRVHFSAIQSMTLPNIPR